MRARRRLTRWVAGLSFLAMAGFWVWAFSPLPKRGHPDNLNFPEFHQPAEVICLDARGQLDQLDKSWTIDSPQQLATQVSAASEILDAMVSELEALEDEVALPETEERKKLRLWLADWRTYLGNRDDFVAKLELGERATFTHTAREGVTVAAIVDRFAEINKMAACATPEDI